MKTQVMLGFFALIFLCSVVPVSAQESRSYSYDRIDFAIQINVDTTVDIVETQTYRFVGEYHQGWRNIPKKDFDVLTDVSVVDAATGQALVYSPKQLEKTMSSSWGKYTTFFRNGEYVIEWYYDARDTTRTWMLSYTLHGALSFYDSHDELYWNLFTDYTVPIGSVDASVRLPRAVENPNLLKETLYVDGVRGKSGSRHSSDGFHFFANDLRPGAKVTIAPGWPKGIVDPGAYGRWFVWHYLFIILSFIIATVSLVGTWLYWYFTEKRAEKKNGPVIAEYEPPKNLRPAMASVIIYERVKSSVWAATLVDLAIRGHILIQEKQPSFWGRLGNFFQHGMSAIVGIFFIGFIVWALIVGMPILAMFILFGPIILIIVFRLRGFFGPSKKYILERIENSQDLLEDYEQKLLKIFFPGGKKKLDLSQQKGGQLASRLQKLKKDLYHETEVDTQAYERGFMVHMPEKKKRYTIFVLIGLLVSPLLFFSSVAGSFVQVAIFFITLYWCVLGVWWFVHYDARLSHEGRLLKKDWLGFRLYLETAERHRLQNLTPETFEKYLPYAMLFGIEKKWGKAFDGIVTESPRWYHSASTPSFKGVSTGNFVPSAFSASFLSAVSGAVSPASSGASGGGGRAGGGGGGGGGGAS